jgi:hypothetical protein
LHLLKIIKSPSFLFKKGFIFSFVHYNWGSIRVITSKMVRQVYQTNQRHLFVRQKWEFAITEFVITEFQCILPVGLPNFDSDFYCQLSLSLSLYFSICLLVCMSLSLSVCLSSCLPACPTLSIRRFYTIT